MSLYFFAFLAEINDPALMNPNPAIDSRNKKSTTLLAEGFLLPGIQSYPVFHRNSSGNLNKIIRLFRIFLETKLSLLK